ncbi:bifunctional metallophosphatase/5'-nucleotidase [Brachybacterium aquaticum]|uniref:2',3'-cyclic-nucleotide 2'-phosphodiesterase (5'-nucleotidase family) n=1 Tax=Brachybacterium aquaticum TaxID=1432564 RepID=A0A841AAF7_9MICO|nr:bifunctional UDP-sugar hydrolase/5'-nucleotidase [Brachybacterium aquaticum]MBB5830282.1 2',3'-cyclic-nucleotide 2'-phosphodiesterase (5'-nucleotidase family) [Brachybacterium aquaticum]
MIDNPVRRVARGAAVGLGATAFAFATAVVPISAAAAAEPGDQVTLLGFNDFHGALNGGAALACTVTNARAEASNSVLISSGDNVGGSAFVSAVANDEPTIDFLNALGVDASAIGNHEYDQGQDDLKDRIEPHTDFPDLAANVYQADGTRLHEAYTVVDQGDVKVAVVGAVTTKTVAKVSPAAIQGLEFRDPVDSVNAAIDEMDRDGVEYDVLVVSYHEGATGSAEVGSAPASTEAIFDKIVSETSAEADAIFNGDSHQTYAYNAPVPSQEGEVRPIIQTGASAANLGTVTLELGADGDWDVSEDPNLIATSGVDPASCAGDPVFDAAAGVAADAIDEAAVLGSVEVGTIGGDITTSWNDSKATYDENGVRVPLADVAGANQATTKGDDRTRHSAAGNMLADSMKWYLEESGKAGEHEVIGWMNPGGIRAELWDAAAGAEGDGVVTYAEANNMVPFGNTLNSGEVTGAQFVQMLEDQWNDDTDAFLAFSVSNNVEYIFDSSADREGRIIQVRVNGEPIQDDALYTIVTASFLFEGGDGMKTLAGAQDVRDSGVLDRDAFTEYLGAFPDLAPDYSQRQIDVQVLEAGEYDSAAGIDQDPVLRLSRLESLSLGAPRITSVTVDAGEYGTFEAPYELDDETGKYRADVTLTDWLCVPADTQVPLTVTAIPEVGTEIVFEVESFTWTSGSAPSELCGDDDDDTTTPPPGDDDDDDTTTPPPGDDDDTTTPPPGDDDDDSTTPPPSDNGGSDNGGSDNGGTNNGGTNNGGSNNGGSNNGGTNNGGSNNGGSNNGGSNNGGSTNGGTNNGGSNNGGSNNGRSDLPRTGAPAGAMAAAAGLLTLSGLGALGLHRRFTRG